MALDTTAAPSPISSTFGSNSTVPACTTPMGNIISAPMLTPRATVVPACRCCVFLPKMM